MIEAGHDVEDAGGREAERFELLAVVFRIAERQVAARLVERQLAPAPEAEAHQLLVDVDEILRRRDVVVDEHHPIGQRVGHSRRARADREMVNQDVVGMAGIGQVAIVLGQVLEPRVRRLDEDLRLVSGIAQHALDAQHFVTDGVAVAKGREHLMNRDGHACVCAICVICGLARAASAAAAGPAAATMRAAAALIALPVALRPWPACRPAAAPACWRVAAAGAAAVGLRRSCCSALRLPALQCSAAASLRCGA